MPFGPLAQALMSVQFRPSSVEHFCPLHLVYAIPGRPIVWVGFDANDERKSLGVPVVHVDGAGFNHVSDTLVDTMLAGEAPARSILGCPGISIWNGSEVTDEPEILGVGSRLKASEDELLAVWA